MTQVPSDFKISPAAPETLPLSPLPPTPGPGPFSSCPHPPELQLTGIWAAMSPRELVETLNVNQYNVLEHDKWKIPQAKALHKTFNVRE